MKKQLLLLVTMLLPIMASASDIAVKNADGKTIYYNYIKNGTELEVTYCGPNSSYLSNEYTGNIVIPDSVNYNNVTYCVTRIGNNAFESNSDLTSITIPNSVTSIGSSAFSGCSKLTSVTIPYSVTSMGNKVFSGCSDLSITINSNAIVSKNYSSSSSLKDIFGYQIRGSQVKEFIIGNEVQSIGNYAFCYYDGLTSITIPNSVTSIGNNAFLGCSNLSSVNIPNSVTSIGGEAFRGCSGLTSITIPNSVTSISDGAFSGCYKLSSVTIPDSVTSIGNKAFCDCNDLTFITIPNSVTSISDGAFSGCSRFTSVIIGSGVTSIGSDVFKSTSLKKVIWLTNTPPNGHNNVSGAVNYVSNDNFTSLKNRVVYPFLSSYFDVDGIRYVPVSPSERTCDAIDCVYDSTANKTVIASTVCYKDISMSVINIQPYLAYNNRFIKSLEVDIDGQLSDYAFRNCSNMSTATIGEKVTVIGNDAFSRCSSLESIDIPDVVKTIGSYAFQYCSSLKSAKIGSGVETISDYAFSGCKSLKFFTFGAQVKTIGKEAFSDCTSVIEIVSKAQTPPVCGTQALDDIDKLVCKLFVPSGCIVAYQTADQWTNFFYMEEGDILINEENFPDANFRYYLQNQVYGQDGILTHEEIQGITSLYIGSCSISNLKGIEFFSALTILDCSSNKLSSIDVSKNTVLKNLDCSSNKLKSLDVTNNTELDVLCCASNKLTILDISRNLTLKSLDFSYNSITDMDISKHTLLTSYSCADNPLNSFDVSNNTALISLDCARLNLTNLEISNNLALKSLYCHDNPLTNLDISNHLNLEYLDFSNTNIESIDLSNNTLLKNLICSVTPLTSIDLSNNVNINFLSCHNCQLTSLDLSKNSKLSTLVCGNNQLERLDLTHNRNLDFLSCQDNQLTSLDLPNKLKNIYCSNNQLTRLDVSNCSALNSIDCSYNQLIQLDISDNNKVINTISCHRNNLNEKTMDELVRKLPNQSNATITVISLSDDYEGNVCTKNQVDIAKAKGWRVCSSYYYEEGNFYSINDYEGSDPSNIQNITLDEILNYPVYDLNGRKLNKPRKGINIIGGKKVFNH